MTPDRNPAYGLLVSLPLPLRHALILAMDLGLLVLCYPLAVIMLAPEHAAAVGSDLRLIACLLATAAATDWALDLPRIRLKAYDQQAILRSGLLAGVIGLVAIAASSALPVTPVPAGALLGFAMLFLILMVGLRLILRHLVIAIYRTGRAQHRVLIYGAGQTGVQLATALRTDAHVEPVAFVDDNPTLHTLTIAGLTVHSPVRIEEMIVKRRIDRVVLAVPSLSRPKQVRLARRLKAAGCEVSAMPSFATLIGEGPLLDRIQPVDPSDLLGRDGRVLQTSASTIYAGQVVMITGAGGSIGSELTRQVLACAPRRIVLFELNELALYQLDRELTDVIGPGATTEIVPVLGSITDAAAVRRTLADHQVGIVLHAAAYKHVPMVERNPGAGMANNAIGTKALADAAQAAGVGHFILVSSDKAVRPANVMGASKRFAELAVQDLATRSDRTRFAIVRFGNVLGSSGSVVPLFEEQIARGGPVTLTHPDVTRYFMTVSEATRLVLLAGEIARGGEVFVLDMGPPVPIRRLARQMIESAGCSVSDAQTPDGDIEIRITGLRPGEKLHEELSWGHGPLRPTDNPKILRAEEPALSELEVAAAFKALNRAVEDNDPAALQAVIDRWIRQNVASPGPGRTGDGIIATAVPASR